MFRCAPAAAESAPQYQNIPVESLCVTIAQPENVSAAPAVEWWYSEWDDCRYLFLPAAADRTALTISFEIPDGTALTLNEITVTNGAETDLLGTADTFAIAVDGTDCGELRIMQSAIGSIWFTLPEGDLARIDAEKSERTAGSALILGSDGAVQYDGALEQLGGRGNTSWFFTSKKPYNFKLPQKTDLFGMGAARKWALLSNQIDQSMLRNEIAFAMSRQCGLNFTPDAVFTDLYINGEYRGTYQLAERVLVHENRVNIADLKKATEPLNEQPLGEYPLVVVNGTLNGEEPESYQYYDIPNDPEDITGGYLFQFQMAHRAEKAEFTTSRGQICDITAPEYPSKAQVEYLRSFVQELEDAVYSDTGYNEKGRHYSDYLDMDSLYLGYLIQEITENADGASSSFFFYKDSDRTGDGKLHYGPVWDFDLAYMNYSVFVNAPDGTVHKSFLPDNLFALYVSGNLPAADGKATVGWLLRLWQRDECARRIAVLYEERFDGFLQTLTDQGEGGFINKMRDALRPSAEMNNARWHMYGGAPFKPIGPSTGESFTECVEYVRSFLVKRQAYLSETFRSEGKARCIQIFNTIADNLKDVKYDAKEQKQITALQKDTAAKLKKAESAAEADALLAAAEAKLDTIPRTKLTGDFDLNGIVDVTDAQKVLLYYVDTVVGKERKLNASELRNGDTDGSGVLDLDDAMAILKIYTDEFVKAE